MGRRLLQVGEQKRSWSCVYFPWLNGSDSLPGQPWTKPVSCLEHWAAKLGSGGGGQDKGPYSAGFPALLSLLQMLPGAAPRTGPAEKDIHKRFPWFGVG